MRSSDGAVRYAIDDGSDLPDGAIIACVVRGFSGLSFPKPEGGSVTVSYPLLFSPGGQARRRAQRERALDAAATSALRSAQSGGEMKLGWLTRMLVVAATACGPAQPPAEAQAPAQPSAEAQASDRAKPISSAWAPTYSSMMTNAKTALDLTLTNGTSHTVPLREEGSTVVFQQTLTPKEGMTIPPNELGEIFDGVVAGIYQADLFGDKTPDDIKKLYRLNPEMVTERGRFIKHPLGVPFEFALPRLPKWQ